MTNKFRFILKIFGCQVNYYDAQKIVEALTASGGKEIESSRDADLIVILACSVRQKAVDKLLGQIRNWRRLKNPPGRALWAAPKIVVVGCVLNPDKKKIKVNWLGSTEDFLMNYAVILKNNGIKNVVVRAKSRTKFSPPDRPPRQPSESKNKDFQGRGEATRRIYQIDPKTGAVYLPITSGCNNFCSFCAVPYTRGREVSRPLEEILREAINIISVGYDYLMLLGQNVNSFGLSEWKIKRKIHDRERRPWTKDNFSPFVKLLSRLEKIKKLKKIGFLSPNPQDVSDDLIWWLNTSKKFDGNLHLPLQSGSDKILRMMNRQYTAQEFEKLVQKIRRARPDIIISTDIIIGFPGETKKDFKDTVKLVKKCQFKKAYIAQYSPRLSTLAAKKFANNISSQEKNQRFHRLDLLINR